MIWLDVIWFEKVILQTCFFPQHNKESFNFIFIYYLKYFISDEVFKMQ